MATRIDVKMEVQVPRVPNFLILPNGGNFDVADLTDGALREIGDLWVDALIENAQKRRKMPLNDNGRRNDAD